MGVVDVKALAERAGSSQRAKMRELEELLAIRDRLEREIEGDFRYGFRTIDQVSAGWDEFYQIEGQIEENEHIIREYSQLLLELSSFSLRLEQMRDIFSGFRKCLVFAPVVERSLRARGEVASTRE